MSFCANCGTEVKDGINFCPKCGSGINSNAISNKANSAVTTLNNIQDVRREASKVYNYFNAKKDLFDEAVSISRELQDDSYPRRWYLLLLAFTFIPAALIQTNETAVVGWIVCVIWFVLFFFLIALRKKKIRAMDEHLENIKARQEDIFEYLEEYYDAYENCPVSIDYIWPDELEKITDYILSGRADTFKEAVNLFHQQEQIEEMQNKMNEMVYNSQMASAKAGLAAHYSALDYFTK